MSVRPSDVSRPRDDSMVGTTRRIVVWTAIAAGALAVLLGGVQIAAVIDGGPRPAFTVRASLGELVTLADPHGPMTRKVALVGGLVVMGLLVGSAGVAIGGRVLEGTGLAEHDRRLKRQLDGARWATHEDLAPVLVRPYGHQNRVVLGAPIGIRRRPTGELVAVEPGHSA